MTRAAIYARFSSHKQHEESIETQVEACRRKADEMGAKVVALYADRGISGRGTERRTEFTRAIEAAERGSYDVLLVYTLDRFARNRYDSAIYRSKLRKAGVELVSATQSIPEGPEGIILESMLEGIAEYYSADLSRKVIDNMTERAEDCQHLGVEVYGYAPGPDGRYVIDEERAPAVRDAFARVAAGESRSAVADALNAAGYRTIRGRKWRVDTVTRMIANEKYKGTYVWDKVRVEGGMPAIVDADTFAAANDRLKRAPRRRRGKSAPYLLSGIIYDTDGNRLVPDCGKSRTGAYHYYYRSRASHVAIRRDEVEGRVRGAVADLVAGNPALVDAVVSSVMAEQERVTGAEMDAARSIASRLDEIDREQDRLIDLVARTGATDRIASRIMELDRERESLREEAEEAKPAAIVLEEDFIRFMLHKMSMCDGPDSVVRGFVSRVVVSPEHDVFVGFTITPDGGLDDGDELVRAAERSGSHCYLTRTPYIIPVRGGFFIAA